MDTFYSRLVAHRILCGKPKRNQRRYFHGYRERKWEEIPIEDYTACKIEIRRERGRTIWDFGSNQVESESKEEIIKTEVFEIEFPDSPIECVAVWISNEYYFYPIKIDGEQFYMDNLNYIYEKEPKDVFSIPFLKYVDGKLVDLD